MAALLRLLLLLTLQSNEWLHRVPRIINFKFNRFLYGNGSGICIFWGKNIHVHFASSVVQRLHCYVNGSFRQFVVIIHTRVSGLVNLPTRVILTGIPGLVQVLIEMGPIASVPDLGTLKVAAGRPGRKPLDLRRPVESLWREIDLDICGLNHILVQLFLAIFSKFVKF